MRVSRFATSWSPKFALFLAFTAISLCSVNRTSGAPISVTIKSTGSVGNAPSPSPDVRLQLFAEGGGALPVVLLLPGVAPDSMERLLNYQVGDPPSHVVMIRKEDAANYGFNWDAFEDRLLGRDKSVLLRFEVPNANSSMRGSSASASVSDAIFNSGQLSHRTDYWFETFEMEEIRVQIDYYFWHPVLTGLRASRVSFEVVGSGIVIPEPTAACLLMLATPLILSWRQRC